MENFKNHTFILRRTSEQTTHAKVQLEFIEPLLLALKRNVQNYYLNLPETIVSGFGCNEPHMIYTKENGQLSWLEGIKSSSVQRFFKRCYYFKREPFPVNIIKSDKGNFADSCRCLMSTKESFDLWKQQIKAGKPMLIQRFIISPKKEISKVRITYIPPKGYLSCKLLRNKIDINGELVKPPIENKNGWNKFRKFQTPETVKKDYLAEDKFLVRKSVDSSYTESDYVINDSLRTQMETLKNIVEKGHFAHGKIICLELQADFGQDTDEKWYFLNLIHYKAELSVQKKLNPTSFGLLMERLSGKTIKSAYGSRKRGSADKIMVCSTPCSKIEPAIHVIKPRPFSADKTVKSSSILSPEKPAARLLSLSSIKLKSNSSALLEIPRLDESQNNSTGSLKKEIMKDLKSISKRDFEIRRKRRSKTMGAIKSKIK